MIGDVLLIVAMIVFLLKYCKVQPHHALLGYPFHNTAAHTEATPTREGVSRERGACLSTCCNHGANKGLLL